MKLPTPHPSMSRPRFSKRRRAYLEPIAYEKDNPHFEQPPFTNNNNLELPLRIILPEENDEIQSNRVMVFHAVGDSGGIHGDNTQVAVAEAMESQMEGREGSPLRPRFFYHLGDVIYFNGQSINYTTQFYEPYKYYPGPIFAIPGNHDGDIRVRQGDPPDGETTLYGFMENFCAPQPHQISPYRATMTQPYVYWTLKAPLLNIIGLYSNVEGSLDARGKYEQLRWLENQLQAASKEKDKFLVIAVHHPAYSLDQSHGGSPDIAAALDEAMSVTGVMPHLVLSGHVHNYQRFTRRLDGRQIPYVVDGRGGYANTSHLMHKLQKDDAGQYPSSDSPTVCKSAIDPELDLTLEAYEQEQPGFLRITVTDKDLAVDAFAVPFEGEFRDTPIDTVKVNLKGRLV